MIVSILVVLIVMGVFMAVTVVKALDDKSFKTELGDTNEDIELKDKQIKELTKTRDEIIANIRKKYVEIKQIDPELKAPAQKT